MSLPLHNTRIDGVELPIGIMIGGRLYDGPPCWHSDVP